MSNRLIRKPASRHWLIPVFAVCLGMAVSAHAIIIRHDRNDSRYQVLPGQYPQVFYLHQRYGNKLCVATLIDHQWALTAAHCTMETPLGEFMSEGENYAVTLGSRANAIDRVEVHPGFDSKTSRYAHGVDLALLHLRDAQEIEGISLYAGDDELTRPAMLLGWGYTGNGAAGRKNNDGELRRAWNVVSRAENWLEIQFDDPRIPGAVVMDYEGMPGLGDSGGPALLETAQGLALIGIARGEMLTGEDQVQGLYGSVAIYERLSLHREWIEEVVLGSRTESNP